MGERPPFWLDSSNAMILFVALLVMGVATPNAGGRRVLLFAALGVVLYGAVVAMPAYAVRWRRWRERQRRQARGLCIQCGYNLTGNRSGRCPECGSVIDG